MKSKWSQDLYIKALKFVAKAHKNQKVPGSNLPYIVHLNLVSMEIMAALSVEDGLNGDLAVQCALLHDVIEDADVPHEKVKSEFGSVVADGVLALTKDEKVGSDIEDKHKRKELMMADSLHRIKQQSPEIWMVKMADRITNLQPPPSTWSDEKVVRYKQEAILIYNELKDASPYLAERLKSKIENYKEKREPRPRIKKEALEILKKYEIEKLERKISEFTITDVKPDWLTPYGLSENDEYWYCIPKPSGNRIGASRIVCISKSTGKVIFDSYCGE